MTTDAITMGDLAPSGAELGVLRVVGYRRKSRVTLRDRRVRERAEAKGISVGLASLEIQGDDIKAEIAASRDGRQRRLIGFCNDVISGRRSDRSGRNTIYQLAEAKAIDEVWVWAFDRWSREDEMEAMATLNSLWRCGVRVLSVQEPWIDAYGDKSRYNRAVYDAFERASFELKRLIDRSGSGLARARTTGTLLGSVPFGFKLAIDRDRTSGLVTDPDELPTLRLMFELRRDGKSLNHIGAITGRATSSINFILHGSRSGRLRTQPQVDRLREAVGPELFDAVQTVARAPSFHAEEKWPFMLKGLVKCPHCGRTLTGHRSARPRKDGSPGTPSRLLVCKDPRGRFDADGDRHPWRSVKESAVLEHVQCVLDAFVATPELESRVLELLAPRRQTDTRIDDARRRRDIEVERGRVEALYRRGLRTLEWFEREDGELDDKLAELDAHARATAPVEIERRIEQLKGLGRALADVDRTDLVEVGIANTLLRAMIKKIRLVPESKEPLIEWEPEFKDLLAAMGADRARPARTTVEWVTAVEASRVLGIPRWRVRELIRSGAIPASSTGSGRTQRHRIPRDWLEHADAKALLPAPPADRPKLEQRPLPWVTALEASQVLGIQRWRVRELIKSGGIPASSSGNGRSRRHRIPRDWLEDQVRQHERQLDKPGSRSIGFEEPIASKRDQGALHVLARVVS